MDYPNHNTLQKILRGMIMSILLMGFLTIRKNGLLADFINPSMSFHLYHVVIAVWIFAITALIKKPQN